MRCLLACATSRRLHYEAELHPRGTCSLQGTRNTGENLMKLDVSQSFLLKFSANPPLSVMNYQCHAFTHCQHSLYTIWQNAAGAALQQILGHSVNIHMAVQVVIWVQKCLWPLHLSVQFAVHLACVVPKPVPLNKDRLFAAPSPTLCSTHNTSCKQCQAGQIKSGLNKIYLHLCMRG